MHDEAGNGPGRRRGIVIVTGASSGIGGAIARRLARDGWDLVLTARDAERVGYLVKEVESVGQQAIARQLDLSSLEGIEAFFRDMDQGIGVAQVLVNNAGCILRRRAVDVTIDDWNALVDVNVRGTFFMTQAFARRLIAAEQAGQVINIGSTHGRVGFSERSVYGLSKAAVEQLGRMLAIEWAAQNIRVNTIVPGTIETSSREALLSREAVRDRLLARIPLGRLGVPSDVASAVSFLASEESSFMTGTSIVIDGGTTAV